MNSKYHTDAIALLKQLIATPSLSGEEQQTADIIAALLTQRGLEVNRHLNNIWALLPNNEPNSPTVLLNSHHDTVRPSAGWSVNPFVPQEQEGKITGLGSNDAGASVVSQLATFLYFFETKTSLPFNLIYSATAEEETSGEKGVESILAKLGHIDLAIIGEPTKMEMAIAEKGLMVLDCTVKGQAGHAARTEGVNAIYKALPIISWFKTFHFPEISEVLGEVKMSVTQIDAGYQHNMVPDICRFVVDVRTNEHYSNAAALKIILDNVSCTVEPRSLRLNSSAIAHNHPIVKAAKALMIPTYGSPTTSDQAVIHLPSVKMGPGDSARSHTPNEYILTEEINNGIEGYIKLLSTLKF